MGVVVPRLTSLGFSGGGAMRQYLLQNVSRREIGAVEGRRVKVPWPRPFLIQFLLDAQLNLTFFIGWRTGFTGKLLTSFFLKKETQNFGAILVGGIFRSYSQPAQKATDRYFILEWQWRKRWRHGTLRTPKLGQAGCDALIRLGGQDVLHALFTQTQQTFE